MKKLLLLLLPLLLVLSLARAQTITQTPGVPHTLGTPTGAPSPLTKASWLRYDKTNKILYRWTGAAWTAAMPLAIGDGDKGDITVSSSGTVWSIDAGSGGIYDGDGFLSETPTSVGLYNSATFAARELEFRVHDDGLARTVARFGGISGDDDGDRFGLYSLDENGVKKMALYSDEDASPTGGILIDDNRATPLGLQYTGNYTATFSARSLVDKAYVTTANATNANLTGPVTSVGNATTITANSIDSTKVAASGLSPSDLGPSGASVGQVMTYTVNGWRPAAAGGGGDGNGIYDGSGTVPSGAVATGTAFALRTIVPADGFYSALRFDTLLNTATGAAYSSPGSVLLSGYDGLASVGGGFVQIRGEEGRLQLGSLLGAAGSAIDFDYTATTFTDNTAAVLGIQYAADYSTTIAANDRSIPDVGTVKGLGFDGLRLTADGLVTIKSSSDHFSIEADANPGKVARFDQLLLTNNRTYTLPDAPGTLLVSADATATLNFPSTAAGTCSDLTIIVTGAADGNPVTPGVPNASTVANGSYSAWVSAADTVKIRFCNHQTVTALDPASGTFRATVLKY